MTVCACYRMVIIIVPSDLSSSLLHWATTDLTKCTPAKVGNVTFLESNGNCMFDWPSLRGKLMGGQRSLLLIFLRLTQLVDVLPKPACHVQSSQSFLLTVTIHDIVFLNQYYFLAHTPKLLRHIL